MLGVKWSKFILVRGDISDLLLAEWDKKKSIVDSVTVFVYIWRARVLFQAVFIQFVRFQHF